MLAKEPEAQETQLVAPADAYHLPASHALHVLMPVLEYLPVSQGVQVPAAPPPASSDAWMSQYFYLCTSSCVSICTVVLANLYWPGSQAPQAADAVDDTVAGVYDVHTPQHAA